MKKIAIFLISIICTGALMGQDVISVEDLTKILRDQNLVVISAGPKAEYDKQHITGSINIPYNAFDKTGAVEGLLIPASDMAKILGDQGVSEKNMIVVYDEFDGRYAARIHFLLKYLGVQNVKILDGGLEAWKAGRKPITRNPTSVTKKTFTPSVNNRMILSAQDLSSNRSNSVLVDARSAGEFQGRENNSKGHIQGAIHVEYKEVLTSDGKLKSKAELEKLYAAKGISKDKEIVFYCSSGVRTGLHYLVLTSILNYPNVKVYDGGYNEWVSINPGKIVK